MLGNEIDRVHAGESTKGPDSDTERRSSRRTAAAARILSGGHSSAILSMVTASGHTSSAALTSAWLLALAPSAVAAPSSSPGQALELGSDPGEGRGLLRVDRRRQQEESDEPGLCGTSPLLDKIGGEVCVNIDHHKASLGPRR